MREIKFEYGFTNHAQIRVSIASIEIGLYLDEIGEIKYRRQYTGLKDKNGVEIYEGDIVSIFGGIAEIEFHEGSFGYWIWKEEKYRNFITATISDKDEIEVISNIYENKDLLK